MNCYVGMAKRIVKSCFKEAKTTQVIPIPQLQPLDAKNIIKHRSYQVACEEATKYPCERWKEVYGAHMSVSFKPKPLSAEEAWETALIWAEAKAQERESATTKAASQTDTDESYDSDDSEVGVYIHPTRRTTSLFYNKDEDTNNIEEFARTKWEQIASMIAIWGAKDRAATIIQAAVRGRAARLAAWDATYAALDAALLMRLKKERRRAAKNARRTLNAALNQSTWYRV